MGRRNRLLQKLTIVRGIFVDFADAIGIAGHEHDFYIRAGFANHRGHFEAANRRHDHVAEQQVDFGVVFGAAVAFPLGSVQLIIDGRYDLGLTNVNDTEGDDESLKNRAWQFMAGVGFPVGG